MATMVSSVLPSINKNRNQEHCRPTAVYVSIVVALCLLFTTATATAQGYRSSGESEVECSQVVGVCGSALWRPPMLRTEFGISHWRARIGATSSSTGTLMEAGELAAPMTSLRFLFGYRGYYLGSEVSFGRIDAGKLVVTPPLSLSTTDPAEHPGSKNLAVGLTLNPGRELRYGRLVLGVELQVGVGVITIGSERMDTPWLTESRFLLNAQARAGVWLTRNITLTGNAGASMVRADERMFGLMIGFTPMPYDGL